MASSRLRKRLRMTGLIIGLIWAGWFIFLLVTLFTIGIQGDLPHVFVLLRNWRNWWLIILSVLVSFGSIAIAWKWELLGGMILIIEGLVLIGLIITFSINLILLATGLPLLVSGVLILASWWIGRKYK